MSRNPGTLLRQQTEHRLKKQNLSHGGGGGLHIGTPPRKRAGLGYVSGFLLVNVLPLLSDSGGRECCLRLTILYFAYLFIFVQPEFT